MKKSSFAILLLLVCASACAPMATTTSPTEAPVQSILTFASARSGEGVALEPGTYQTPTWYEIPLTMDIPDGWRAIHLREEHVLGLVQGSNESGTFTSWLFFIPIYDADADAFFEDFKASPELQQLGDTIEVSLVGLYPATQLDMQALPNPDFAGQPDEGILPGTQILSVLQDYITPADALDFTWTTSSVESHIRIFKVNFGERVAILYIEAPQDEFDSFLASAHEILETLQPVEH